MPRGRDSHHISYDNPKSRTEQQADCGAWAKFPMDHSDDPTCPRCRRIRHLPPKAGSVQETHQMTSLPLPEPEPEPLPPAEPEAPPTAPAGPREPEAPPAELLTAPVDLSGVKDALASVAKRVEGLDFKAEHIGRQLVDEAQALTVTDAATFARAQVLYAALAAAEAAVHDDWDDVCKAAYDAWQIPCGKRKARLDGIEAAKVRVNRIAGDWEREQKRLTAEATRAAEAQAKVEQEAKIKAEIAQARATGNKDAVQELKLELKNAPPPAVSVPSTVPESTGATKRGGAAKWTVGISDWAQLRKLIGEGKYPEFDAALQEACIAVVKPLAKTLQLTVATKYPGMWARDDSGAFSAKGGGK